MHKQVKTLYITGEHSFWVLEVTQFEVVLVWNN